MASKLEEITTHIIAVDDYELNIILSALALLEDGDAEQLITELSDEFFDSNPVYFCDGVDCCNKDLAEEIMGQIYDATKNGVNVSVGRSNGRS